MSAAQLAESPEGSVVRAFRAYEAGSSRGINSELSRLGHVSADFFCGGQTFDCLSANYGKLGNILTSKVVLTRQTDTSARVVLKTTWANHASELCQEYSLDTTPAGWRITYIDNPRAC
jgi:hypothetical protein